MTTTTDTSTLTGAELDRAVNRIVFGDSPVVLTFHDDIGLCFELLMPMLSWPTLRRFDEADDWECGFGRVTTRVATGPDPCTAICRAAIAAKESE